MDTRRLGRAHVRAPGAHRPRRRPRVRRQPDRGLRTHVAEVAQRTGATVVVQLDEPGLPAVLAGSLPTASGYGTVRAIAAPDAQDLLRDLVDGVDAPVVVHCCADRPPIRLLAGTGAAAVGIDATRPAFAGAPPNRAPSTRSVRPGTAVSRCSSGCCPAPRRPANRRSATWPAPATTSPTGWASTGRGWPASPSRRPPAGSPGVPAWAQRALALSRELGKAFADPDEVAPADGR